MDDVVRARLILDTDHGEQLVSLVTEINTVVTFRGPSGGPYRQTWPERRALTPSL
jgi:hypothetical protein